MAPEQAGQVPPALTCYVAISSIGPSVASDSILGTQVSHKDYREWL